MQTILTYAWPILFAIALAILIYAAGAARYTRLAREEMDQHRAQEDEEFERRKKAKAAAILRVFGTIQRRAVELPPCPHRWN